MTACFCLREEGCSRNNGSQRRSEPPPVATAAKSGAPERRVVWAASCCVGWTLDNIGEGEILRCAQNDDELACGSIYGAQVRKVGGRPLVSSPHGVRSRPAAKAIAVRATGVPMLPKWRTPAPTRKVIAAPMKRAKEVEKAKALARHSVGYCSGSQRV